LRFFFSGIGSHQAIAIQRLGSGRNGATYPLRRAREDSESAILAPRARTVCPADPPAYSERALRAGKPSSLRKLQAAGVHLNLPKRQY